MVLRTYADWENAVRVARVVHDHSQARMVCKRTKVRNSKKLAFLSVIPAKDRASGGISSTSERIETPACAPRKPRIDVKKSQCRPHFSCTNHKTEQLQIFIAIPLASTICLQLPPSTSISAVKELLQDQLGVNPEKQHLFTRKEMELCDALSLEDHCIHQDTNLELRLVAGLMGGRRKHKSAKKRHDNPKPQPQSPASQSDSQAQPAREPEGQHGGEHTAAGATARDPLSTPAKDTMAGNQNRIKVEGDPTNRNPSIYAEGKPDTRLQPEDPMGGSDTTQKERRSEEDYGAAGATARQEQPSTNRGSTEINIEGKRNRVDVRGDAYNFYGIPMLMEMILGKKLDDDLARRWLKIRQDCIELLQDILKKHATTIETVSEGSVKFLLRVKSRKGLDSLWVDYSSGKLAREFGDVIITGKLTSEDKSNITIRLKILESDYKKGCEFFDSRRTDPIKLELPVRMSDWTVEHVRQWLLDIEVSDSVASEMYREGTDGKVLEMYTKDDLSDDYANMTKSDIRRILYKRERWLEAEKQQGSPSRQEEVIREPEQHAPHSVDTQGQPMSFTSAPLLGDYNTQPAVRPKAVRTIDKPSPKKKAKTVLTEHPQQSLETAPMHQKSDEKSDVTAQQRPQQPPSQAVDEEQHTEARLQEAQAKEKPKSELPGDRHASVARRISEEATTDEARLRMLLTGDEHGELDQSYYPVLIANKPAPQPEDHTDAIASQFGFIKTVNWTTVLDFDSKSKVNGLCKLYHEDRMVSLQQPELFKDIESDEDFRNTIEFPEKTVWVFANGREDDQNIQTPKMTLPEWHKERRRDVENAVRFFSNPSIIPMGRAIIMFLLLSEDDLDILCDTFGKLSSSFEGLKSIVCIAEDQELYSKFVSYVTRWFSKDDVYKRSLVGLEWQEINKIMMRMNGVNQTTRNELPSNLPEQCFLSEKQKDEWNDITVVCRNECENTDMDDTNPSYQQFVKRKELDFYHGEKVDWWNFAIGDKDKERSRNACGHVLKRKGFGQVLRKVRQPLDSTNSGDSLIVTVTLLHQPGAGGSTLARYVLWELHKEYRCVVVDRITTRTVNQIMEVRHHGYDNEHARRIPPVCVLVDNLDDVEVLDLILDLEDKSRNLRVAGGAVCVLLHCKRVTDPLKAIHAKDRDPDLYIELTQKLDQAEKTWFQQKYAELEEKGNKYNTKDYNPDNLLAFMVMKEEFNKEYITDVVSRILQGIKGNEMKLIKLCALLNSYIHEADIPISCCDTLMTDTWSKGIKIHFSRHTSNWEKLVSASFKIMVVITESRTIKILHKSIAEEALRQTMKESEDQSLADVTLEFLDSELLRSSSYSRKILAKTTHDLLIRRERVGQGENTKTDFAILIEDICKNEGSKKAIQVLTRGVEILQDAFVAQQLARFYLIKEKDFNMADTFAQRALDMNPPNSFFFDTKGRVYKAHIDTLTEQHVLEQQDLSGERLNEVLSLSFEAMKTFRRSYEVSKEKTPWRIEYTGLYTELNVAFRLLQVIHLCVEPFRTKGDINVLKMYLLKLDLPPGVCPPVWDTKSQTQVRELKNRVDEVLDIMDGKTTCYKDGSTAYTEGRKLDEMRENIKKYSIIYKKYYGEPQPVQRDRYKDKDPTSVAEYRRRRVEQLHCGNFREIFDRAKAGQREDLEISRDLLKLNSSNFNWFDLRNLICIYLALSSMGDKSVSADSVYVEFVRPFYAMGRSTGESCWPSLLMMMFLWPIKDAASERRDARVLTQHIAELQTKWNQDRTDVSFEQLPQVHERNRRQRNSNMKPRTHFFLGQGEDLEVFAHITELHVTQGKLDRNDLFWKSDLVKQRLQRLEGTLLNATSLRYRFHKDKDPIDIKLAVPYRKLASQEAVTFYLGFSWNGPVAYDVTILKDKEGCEDYTTQPSFSQAYPKHILQSGKSKVSPSDNLSEIGELLKKREELLKKMFELSSVPETQQDMKDCERELEKVKKQLERAWRQQDIYGDHFY